jgi:hypothetical protein
MEKIVHTFSLLTSLLALGAGACSSSSGGTGTGGTTGNGGSGGAGNPFAGMGIALIPTGTGFVDDRTNSGVYGPWYGYADSAGPAAGPTGTDATDFAHSSCNLGGFMLNQCSTIMPKPGQPFPPDASGAMCGSGVGTVVIAGSNGQNDYSHLWGAGIALDLNNAGLGDAGMASGDAGVTKGHFDLSKYKGIGFTFSGTMIPPGNKLRVNFPFDGEHQSPTGGDSPYWMGASLDHSPLTNNDTVTIRWADVGGPYYLTQQSPPSVPPAFDPTTVQSIQFQVFTNASTTTPFAFCVNNLTLLTE